MSKAGLAAFNDMRTKGKFVDAPKERAYATCVANALEAVLPPPWNTQQWEVQIIDDNTPNAFALPGGRIGVNRGMTMSMKPRIAVLNLGVADLARSRAFYEGMSGPGKSQDRPSRSRSRQFSQL